MSCEGQSGQPASIGSDDLQRDGDQNNQEEPQDEKNDLETGSRSELGLSKHALKKLKNRERWLEHRKRKRMEEKQRKKEKRTALKEAGLGVQLRRFRGKTMEQSTCKIRVAIDMSFDHLMSEKDCRRLVQQLNWSYSANRRCPEPLQFYITSFSGQCRKIYESIESNQHQDIILKRESLDELFKADDIVYLTADSDNVLSEPNDSKVYVIGGLVDHNSQKGLCLELAKSKGYDHARLPIDEFVEMKTRKVLTVNHVFEILVHYSTNHDWEKSFFMVIPQRKGAKRKEENKEEIEDDGLHEQELTEVDENSDSPEPKRQELVGNVACS